MIRTIRLIYLGRPSREKFLILLLLVAMVALWLSGYTTRLGLFLTETRHTSTELKTQAMWLHNQDRIEHEARDQAAQLDPTQTLDGPRLNAALATMANDAGLQFNEGGTQSTTAGQFTINTVDFGVNRASWESLSAFYLKVQARAPYISIEALSIIADKANPALLNASMKISAVEIVRH
jgi:hypothetical protein